MHRFTDTAAWCARVLELAKSRGWVLALTAPNVPLRFAWQWSYHRPDGVVAQLGRRESMFPGRAEAEFCACLELVQELKWSEIVLPDVRPLELVPPAPGMEEALG